MQQRIQLAVALECREHLRRGECHRQRDHSTRQQFGVAESDTAPLGRSITIRCRAQGHPLAISWQQLEVMDIHQRTQLREGRTTPHPASRAGSRWSSRDRSARCLRTPRRISQGCVAPCTAAPGIHATRETPSLRVQSHGQIAWFDCPSGSGHLNLSSALPSSEIKSVRGSLGTRAIQCSCSEAIHLGRSTVDLPGRARADTAGRLAAYRQRPSPRAR
jgi:hypothetical protein